MTRSERTIQESTGPVRLAVELDRLRGRNVGMWLHRYAGRIACWSPYAAEESRSLALDTT